MKSYQSYLFDLDGTLLDTIGLIIACYRHLFEHIQEKYEVVVSVSEETLRSNVGIPLRQTLEIYLEGTGVDIEEVIDEYRQYQLKIWKDYVKVFDGVIDTLKSLKSAKRNVAVVTSRYLKLTKLYSEHLGLAEFIDVYVTPDTVTESKPHPESAFKAAQLLNSKPAECLFVGDSIHDIRCAQAAGMDSALVLWGAASADEVEKINPSYVISRLVELVGEN